MIGKEESWQIEHIPDHVRKKYACPACETNSDHPHIATAAKPETATEKGIAVEVGISSTDHLKDNR